MLRFVSWNSRCCKLSDTQSETSDKVNVFFSGGSTTTWSRRVTGRKFRPLSSLLHLWQRYDTTRYID